MVNYKVNEYAKTIQEGYVVKICIIFYPHKEIRLMRFLKLFEVNNRLWLQFYLMNFYNISQLPTRLQTAQHYHSSLEEPTLQNVEAQLEVARRRNYELSVSYFQNKYGSGQVFNKYVEQKGLVGLGPPVQQQFDLRRQLERQAQQIRERQTRKLQERKGFREGDQGEIVNKRISKNNIWAPQAPEIKIKDQVKEIEEKKEYLQINLDKEKQSTFISGFKNYLVNKKKIKEDTFARSRQIDQNQNQNQSDLKNTSLSRNKSRVKDAQKPKYQQELVKKIMKDLTGKSDLSSKIQKIQLLQYLNQNQKILKVLGLGFEEISPNIMNFPSKDHNLLTFNELMMFIFSSLGNHDQMKKLKAKQQFNKVPQGCMLNRQVLALFEETFRDMDRHNDLIIKRIPFISQLTNHPLVKKNLNFPAVYEPDYQRAISLRRIFERLQIQTLLCNQEQKKTRQYISWNQFLNYFQSGHKQRAKYDIIILLQSLRSQQKFGLTHLPESVVEIIDYGIKKADKGEQLINTLEIINQIKLHREYEIEKFSFIGKYGEEDISQTFQDALVRIKDNALKYVTPKQFFQYFSLKGKPIEDFQKERNEKNLKNLSAAKVSFVQNEFFSKKDQPDGYDSDPQVYNNSKLYDKSSQNLRKSQKQFKKFKATAQSFMEQSNYQQDHQQSNIKQFKLTIPQPFSFEQRQKQRLARKALQSPSKLENQNQFRAAPAPSSVLKVGIYQKMIEDQNKKNEQRKKCSMIMTLANEKPFSFYNRKANKKTKEERQQFVFKAKPIPWFCSVDLLKKKQQEQIIRNEKIAKVAQQNLAKAKLPPRMQKDYLEKQAKKAIEQQSRLKRPSSSQQRSKPPPDFDRLHRDFEEALQRKRKQNKRTQICEFKFSSNGRNTSKIIPQPIVEQVSKKGEIPSSIKSNIDIFAQSTAKFTQQVQKRRQQMQQKRRQVAQRKKQDEQRKKIDEDLKQKVQEAAKRNKENKQKQQSQKIKQQQNQQNQVFKNWKKSCIQKGRQQPLLIDRISKRDEKIQKMKRLYEISETLKKNGIVGKQHDHYFKRQQILLLQDYKQLKDKL